VFFPDGELRADELTVEDLDRYPTLVLAGVDDLTDHQAALVREYRGRVVEAVDDPQVRIGPAAADLAISIHRVEAGAAVHLIRYGYDEAADAVPPLPRLELSLRLPETFTRADAFSPAGDLEVSLEADGGWHRLVLENVPLYGVVLLAS
jgi:hypothetical protein